MAKAKEGVEAGVQISCFRGISYPSKIKEKPVEVLPCSFPNHDDFIELQEELDKKLIPFREYCGLESHEQLQVVHLAEMKEQLRKVLADGKAKYESLLQGTPRQFRKKWRNRQIKIYDYLLRLALIGPNQSEHLWIKEQKYTDHFYCEASSKLELKSFYTYLVDQVYEDEEIMFKYYCDDKGKGKGKDKEKPFEWRKDVASLVGAIYVYFDIVVGEAVDALRPWKYGNQTLCDDLVKNAKAKIVNKLFSLHGRCFKKERNWRNRARFYYLLGLTRHTGISNGRPRKFKSLDYEGPICRLIREMIVEDEDLFDQESKDQDLPLVCKEKYRKGNKGSFLGHLKVDSVLAWASASSDLGFVRVLLEYYLDSVNSSPNYDFMWEKSMGESWAMALWNASYRGHARIVKELLSWEIPYQSYYSEYFSDETIGPPHRPHEPPLHMAVSRMDLLVVEAFCTTASVHLNCNEKNPHGLTPLEIATQLKVTNDKTKAIKRKIQNLLLQRPEVKDAVKEVSFQRQLAVDSSNAVMVGGTLIAGITFGGWLSPPLGYNSYYQLVETTTAAPPNSYESYMAVQGHLLIQLFAIFNSLSFYFAIASVVAGMETFGAIKVVEDAYMVKTVIKLKRKLTWATNLFLASVVCVLGAFSCAGIAVLPPIKKYQTNMYITTAVGGFICILFICKMVWYALPKKFRNKDKWNL